MQKVYIKINSLNLVTAIDSSTFLTDTTDWILIAEGEGDRYTHAQGNYFPLPIVTDGGAYRYKYVDGQCIERTAEEIAADEQVEAVPEESTENLLLEMAADHEYRLCLLELGVTEDDL